MHSFIINFIHFFYVYGWFFLECLLLVILIKLVLNSKRVSSYLVFVVLVLFFLSALCIIFNNDYIAGKLGEIIFILLAVSSISFFMKDKNK